MGILFLKIFFTFWIVAPANFGSPGPFEITTPSNVSFGLLNGSKSQGTVITVIFLFNNAL